MESLNFYLRVAFVGSFDLVAGTTIAYLVQNLFRDPQIVGPLNEIDVGKWFEIGLDLFVQCMLTLFIAVEIKRLFLGFEDPTGGLLFILSVFRQPNFWAKVDVMADAIYNLVMGDVYPSMFTSK